LLSSFVLHQGSLLVDSQDDDYRAGATEVGNKFTKSYRSPTVLSSLLKV
jgi:hypothetical protein